MSTYQQVKATWSLNTKPHMKWLEKTMDVCQKQLRHLNLMYVSPRVPDNDSKDLEIQWHWEGDSVLHQFTKVFDVKQRTLTSSEKVH